ncbi:hypothetical protein O6H91_09G115300 [Diphasiastrum complanatum]|nr:hypothetical protein O6H91_09G115300 [Diphasiastrum complanatum]
MDLPVDNMKGKTLHPAPDRLHPHLPEYAHRVSVKKGFTRLERHPATGMSGAPKKAGHGGKYTWVGPVDPEQDLEPTPPALDERDPNYVEDDELPVGESELPKNTDELLVGENELPNNRDELQQGEVELPINSAEHHAEAKKT